MTDKISNHRRSFLKQAGAGAVAGAATLAGAPAIAASTPAVKWRLASSFPKSLDTIYGGAEYLAERVRTLTEGKFDIRVFASGELVPGLKVLDAVQDGTVECGHSASFYYIGKDKTFSFDISMPFGMTARQQNAWMYYGGGMQLMREFFAGYNIVNFPGGNTGCQMGGWFRKEVNSLADLKGLKMRVGGLGGQIMGKFGLVPQQIAAGDIYPSLEKGTIDATEWIGPYDDEKLGFYKIAKHYYYPGWWEAQTQLSFYVNKKEWDKLPKLYQEVLATVAAEVNIHMMAEYDHKNPPAILRLLGHGVKLHRFPQDVMVACHKEAFDLYNDESGKNPAFKKIFNDWNKYRVQIQRWHGLAEATMENFLYTSGARR